MSLTTVEKQMLETLELVQAYLTRKNVDRKEYLDLIAAVRDAVQAGRNKFFGCPMGLHAVDCTCDKEVPGISIHSFRYRKKK